MRLLRALLALGAAAAVVVTAGPAQAAQPTIVFHSPTPGQRLATATFPVDVEATAPGSGSLTGELTVAVKTAQGQPASNLSKSVSGRTDRLTQTITLGVNGSYRAEATVTGRDGVVDPTPESRTVTVDFLVDAPPAAPVGVTTAVDKDRHVTVSWNANTEPDLVGYEVQRRIGSGSWDQLVVTAKTTAVDTSTDQAGGAYGYRVVAFRRSADPTTALPSEPSSVRTANVPAPPVTTTTTTPGDEGDGGTTEQERGRSDGRTTTEGRTTGGSGSGSTSGSGSKTPASTGRVDMSGFAALLAQADRAGAGSRAAAGEDEGGFEERLPFKPRTRPDSGAGDDQVVIGEDVGDDGSDRVRSLAFLAGGLLATVLLMHVLWVRNELHRAEHLETVVPEEAGAEAPAAPARFDAWARFKARRAGNREDASV